MIDSLRGVLLHADPKYAVVECGGVGYKCLITANTVRRLPKPGDEALLYTVLQVREDAMELIGFADKNEQHCFSLLTTVSGVGAKVAVAILSEFSSDRVAVAIAAGDYKILTRAPGVGTKLAQRIILELKDKIGVQMGGGEEWSGDIPVPGDGTIQQAVSALQVLGFSASEAAAAVKRLDPALPTGELVKKALQSLAKRP